MASWAAWSTCSYYTVYSVCMWLIWIWQFMAAHGKAGLLTLSSSPTSLSISLSLSIFHCVGTLLGNLDWGGNKAMEGV